MKLSEELAWRGFVKQTTFQDTARLDEETRTFYWGVDPSASSMTIGNLAAAMMAKVFMRHGWKAVILIGGATGMIGDPDGKKQERDLKDLAVIEENKKGIVAQYRQVFGDLTFEVVDNYDWFKNIGYLDFLREVGKHVSITQMLDRSFVQDRIGEGGAGISYAEFSYSLIQGFDFVHLFKEHDVTMQLCGADQWGNSIAGVDLIRRKLGGEAHVYSCPLIVNKSTGIKFGKSEDGAVWLDAERTSPYVFYQFWLNADDAGVIDYIKVYTELDADVVAGLEQQAVKAPHERAAQKRLAFEVTKNIHGQLVAEAVVEATEILFSREAVKLTGAHVEILKSELPVVEAGVAIVDALVAADIVKSKSEARRMIDAGSVRVNGEKLDSQYYGVADSDLIKVGKNKFALVAS